MLDLKQLITELEVRIETRNQEIMSMSDILVRLLFIIASVLKTVHSLFQLK